MKFTLYYHNIQKKKFQNNKSHPLFRKQSLYDCIQHRYMHSFKDYSQNLRWILEEEGEGERGK